MPISGLYELTCKINDRPRLVKVDILLVGNIKSSATCVDMWYEDAGVRDRKEKYAGFSSWIPSSDAAPNFLEIIFKLRINLNSRYGVRDRYFSENV